MGQRASGQRLLLPESAQRTSGRDAQTMNFTAAKAVAEAVRTTLGPRGMDKLLLDSSGHVVVTNDGVTILSEMDIEHPAANMIVEVAETLEQEVGDGTTSAVVLTGELLQRAEELVEQDVHPTTVANGYQRATVKASEVLANRAREIDEDDVDTLERVAMTVMTGKSAESASAHLATVVVQAVRTVANDDGINLADVDVRTVHGRPTDETELVDGVLVDEGPVHGAMPSAVADATIAVLDPGIAVDTPEIDAEITVDDPARLQEFQDAERSSLEDRVDAIADAGVDVLFAGDEIADVAAQYLADAGILAVDDVGEDVRARLSRATGAVRITTVEDLSAGNLGAAGSVSVGDLGDDEAVFVEGTPDADVATIILRAGTEGAVDEIERAIDDSLHAVRVAIESGGVLAGGGAPETELALALRSFAEGVGGREQLAIEQFAQAVEVIPRTLAENAGLDPIDSLVELRSRHDDGQATAGLDVVSGEVIDMWADETVEPLAVKDQVVGSATEAAGMILRIDDVISAD